MGDKKKAAKANGTTVYIEVSGGVVQAAYSYDKNVSVVICDHDNEKAEGEDGGAATEACACLDKIRGELYEVY